MPQKNTSMKISKTAIACTAQWRFAAYPPDGSTTCLKNGLKQRQTDIL
jgi:hypothetical protein